MAITDCINVVRNIHRDIFDVYGGLDKDESVRNGLPADKIFLETGKAPNTPYLVIRRGDSVFPPHSNEIPMAHFIHLEYFIAEAQVNSMDELEIRLESDVVQRIRELDAMFMNMLCSVPKYRPFFTSTSEIDEGLQEERGAYLLTRTLELDADMRHALET